MLNLQSIICAIDITTHIFLYLKGLDPAMPLFTDPDNNRKLDSSDAKFVQIIHTDSLQKGKFEATGHADFYVNGGMEQKGCPRDNMSKLFKNIKLQHRICLDLAQ